MLRGLNVETKVAMITITQPTMMATLRPQRSEIGAEKKKPVISVSLTRIKTGNEWMHTSNYTTAREVRLTGLFNFATNLPDCVCSIDRSDNIRPRVTEILFPIRGPLNRIKGRRVISVEYHRGSCHKADVPDVYFLFRPGHLCESLFMLNIHYRS